MRNTCTRGSVLIEFVIALPIMIFFVFAISDFSAYFRTKYTINNLASSAVLVPIAIIQQEIKDSYKSIGNMEKSLKDINMDDVFNKSSCVIFDVFSMIINKTKVKMTCYWSIGKRIKDDYGQYHVKFYQKKVDSQNGGAEFAAPSINANSISYEVISDSTFIGVEVFLQYTDNEAPYIKKWGWIDKWKNFKSSCKRLIDNDVNIFDDFLKLQNP